jgi:NitT/TauT family transport system ATP-binding protein
VVDAGNIRIERVGKTFVSESGDTTVEALYDVDVAIRGGEFVSVVGPSGCGKSTLLMLVGGLLAPSEGRIVVDGSPVAGPRRSVGIMFQTPELFPWRDVLQNVFLPIDVFGARRRDHETRARELLDLVGLTRFANLHPHELSGGMQQRAALCRVLIADPTVILMDEPFGSLDEFTRERLNLELLRVWDEHRKTIVFVTHNIGEAVFMSDRVLVMGTEPGRVLASLEVPFDRPRTPSLLRAPDYTDLVFRIRALLGIDDVIVEPAPAA